MVVLLIVTPLVQSYGLWLLHDCSVLQSDYSCTADGHGIGSELWVVVAMRLHYMTSLYVHCSKAVVPLTKHEL